MKKVLLSLAFVLATGTIMNANSSNEEIVTNKKEAIEIVEDFGCFSSCNSVARQAAVALATDQTDRSTEGELFKIWSAVYMSCVVVQC